MNFSFNFQNITKFFKEIAIIFIGVSISFFVDRCKNNRQDEEAEKLLFQNLIADVQKDSMQLYDLYKFTKEDRMKVEQLYENIEQPEIFKDSLLNVMKSISSSTAFSPLDITYEEMKQNGLSKLIKNQTVKRNIYELYTNYYGDLKIVNDKVSVSIDFQMQPYMFKYFPFINNNSLTKAEYATLIKITKDTEYRNLVYQSLSDKRMNENAYLTTINKVNLVLELLRKK